jgi:acyl-CoA dehydrogenase
VHHARRSQYFQNYLRQLVDRQWLIASATTELGVGGDLRSSICAVEATGDRFRLVKKAPVISYGEQADQILVTSRRAPEAASSDQVHVLVLC